MPTQPETQTTANTPDHRERKVFDNRRGLALLRLFFAACRLLPRTATAKIALRIFLTPGRRPLSPRELAFRQLAHTEEIVCRGRKVAIYRWGNGSRRALLCHAWGGRGTTLGEFVQPLVSLGFTVFAFDAPAHGSSPGRVSDMVEYVSTIRAVQEKHGPFDTAIGHSFGAGNLLWAHSDYGFRSKTVVLMGCFAHGAWVINAFGEAARLPARTVRKMKELLERKYPGELVWERLSMVDMLKSVSVPVLLVHDHGDRTIPFSHAIQLHEASGDRAEFFATSNLGHKRLLTNKDVVDKVINFIQNNTPASGVPQEGAA